MPLRSLSPLTRRPCISKILRSLPKSLRTSFTLWIPGIEPSKPIHFLNGQINDLKSQLTDKDAQIAAANNRIAQDARRIKELEDQIAGFKCDPELETIVNFACASSRITNSQTANVERVANFLNANPNAKVSIKGYASPEGGTNYNQKLSERRANAVKDMLIKKYNIDESRITAEGCGETEMFSKREANRCAINIAK